jgi:acetyltransferase
MSAPSLHELFEPRGVVVVGASSNPEKLGFAMAQSLGLFPGSVQLVNSRPTAGMFGSIGDAVAASDTAVDLAVMCVPAAITATALREAAASGVGAALVCAGGFAEVGGVGADYAAAIDEVVSETGVRVLGPNTSGFFVPGASLYASFVPGVHDVGPGQVAVVAASGGVNHVLSFQLSEAGSGVSIGVGVGAGQDVSAPDVLRYLLGHEQTSAVILHIETVPDGPALLEAVAALAAVKPVIALVVGRNDVSEFAQSHTGALATSWRTTRAILRQVGAVVVDDEEQAVTAASVLARTRLSATGAEGVGLITAQAGPGLIIADALATSGLDVPALSAATRAELGQLLPPLTFQGNPVDTGRPSETFPSVVAAVAADDAIGVLGVYAITEPVVDLASAIAAAKVDPSIPIVLGIDGPNADVARARAAANAAGLALLRGPTRLARGLAAIIEDGRRQAERTADASPVHRELPALEWSGPWDEVRGKELLNALEITTPPRRHCVDRDAAHRGLEDIGGPVAVKLVDATILHKTDIGGVVLGVDSAAALDAALDTLDRAGATEYLIERMAPSGVDLVVGARVDPVFGPIVLVGLGGTTAEVLGDVAIRRAPLSPRVAARMIDDLAGRDLLHGYRGGPSVDVDELGRAVAAIGDIVASGAVLEVEINPLRVTAGGIVALDAVVLPVEETAKSEVRA